MEKGHKVKFIDALDSEATISLDRVIGGRTIKQVGLDYKTICDRIPQDVDFIALGIPFTFLNTTAKELAEQIKQKFSVPIIAGGVLPSTIPNLALKFSDYIIRGEGEIPLAKILTGEKPEKVAGLVSRNFDNQTAERIENLDSIPFPYRGQEFERYSRFSTRGRKDRRTASLITSRGCPQNCYFCSTHATAGYKWRVRSVKNVLEEIRLLNNQFTIDHIEFEDDNLSLNPDRTKDLLVELIRYNEGTIRPLTFSTPNGLRMDTLDEESIKLMKRAGFLSIYLALESGSPEVLKLMNKQLSLDRVQKVAKAASINHLSVLYFVMIGYPGETRERFMESMDFCSRLKEGNNSRFTTFLTRAYPGTKLFESCLKRGYISPNVEEDLFLGTRYQIITPDFNKAELEWRMQYANNVLNGGNKQAYLL
jgi:magnesium-protoporphyrin IX monomethyl ester (oxidative) cyclase